MFLWVGVATTDPGEDCDSRLHGPGRRMHKGRPAAPTDGQQLPLVLCIHIDEHTSTLRGAKGRGKGPRRTRAQCTGARGAHADADARATDAREGQRTRRACAPAHR